MKEESLIFRAGRRALAHVRAHGLSPDDVAVLAGAAGGPKWLVLGHLDRMLFGKWFTGRRHPLFLIGSSIGSWRFAAASCQDPVAAIDRMEAAYIHQTYPPRPTPRRISNTLGAIIDYTFDQHGPREVLSHPVNRLSLLAVRNRHLLASRKRLPMTLGLAAAVMANTLTRRSLRWFFQQTLFFDPRQRPPFASVGRAPNGCSHLTADNLKPALLASGSIPYIMEGVRDIPDTPPGIYQDGGVVDYHLDIPYGVNGKGIVLMPHFSQRIIPGWFDKHLFWRRPSADNLADVLLIAPSPSFVARLPHGKIADRQDFYRFAGDDRTRFACWRQVADAGRILAGDFMEAVESGSIRRRVQKLEDKALS